MSDRYFLGPVKFDGAPLLGVEDVIIHDNDPIWQIIAFTWLGQVETIFVTYEFVTHRTVGGDSQRFRGMGRLWLKDGSPVRVGQPGCYHALRTDGKIDRLFEAEMCE